MAPFYRGQPGEAVERIKLCVRLIRAFVTDAPHEIPCFPSGRISLIRKLEMRSRRARDTVLHFLDESIGFLGACLVAPKSLELGSVCLP
jgi:hypothetical protein